MLVTPNRQAQTQHEAEAGADMQKQGSCQIESSTPQVDFAPSMAALIGVPIPFGSIGQISQPLWNVAHSIGSTSCSADVEDDDVQQAAYTQALRENAAQVAGCTFPALALTCFVWITCVRFVPVLNPCLLQVHTYLNTYAADRRASLPYRDLQRVNQLYSAACNATSEEAKQNNEDADLHRYVEMHWMCCGNGANLQLRICVHDYSSALP